jgi:Circularly permutated YpsA SLOG family
MKQRFKIISGGQTGADRAALEWALARGITHGGWCPKGRKAEDGVIPRQFQLKETSSASYSMRTRRNVRDSGGTVIFSEGGDLAGGTRETADCARKIGKPLLHLVASLEVNEAAAQLSAFLKEHGIVVLNVAGPRTSEEPDIGKFVQAVLSHALKPCIP